MKAWFSALLLYFICSTSAVASDLKTLIDTQQFKQAIKLGQQLQQQQPDSASVLFYTAMAYQRTQQFEKAKTLYESAIEHDPSSPEIYNNLALIYIEQGNLTKASEVLTQAIKAQKSTAIAYDNLSQIYRHIASQAYSQVLDDGTKKPTRRNKIQAELIASIDLTVPTLKVEPVIVASTLKQPIENSPKQPMPDVKSALLNWASAWQEKEYHAYINSYTANYAPRNLTHTEWLSQRKKRILRPGKIRVKVSNLDITIAPKNNKAYVNFDQEFWSTNYQDKVRKRMHLKLIDNQWYISSEVTLSVL